MCEFVPFKSDASLIWLEISLNHLNVIDTFCRNNNNYYPDICIIIVIIECNLWGSIVWKVTLMWLLLRIGNGDKYEEESSISNLILVMPDIILEAPGISSISRYLKTQVSLFSLSVSRYPRSRQNSFQSIHDILLIKLSKS